MASFLVRTNCEYSIEVEAATAEAALEEAAKTPVEAWGQAWAPWEAESEGAAEEDAG